MRHPHLFKALNCSYNFQLDIVMSTQEEFARNFHRYHHCRESPRIYHGNGGALIPWDEAEERKTFGDDFFEEVIRRRQ